MKRERIVLIVGLFVITGGFSFMAQNQLIAGILFVFSGLILLIDLIVKMYFPINLKIIMAGVLFFIGGLIMEQPIKTNENVTKKEDNIVKDTTQKLKKIDEDTAKKEKQTSIEEEMPLKFGLNLSQRKLLFQEIVICERESLNQAEVDVDIQNLKGTPQEKMMVLRNQSYKLEEICKNKLAKKNNVTRENLQEIVSEAVKFGWKYPKIIDK